MVRRHHERVLRCDAVGDRIAHERVDVAVGGDVLGLAVVGAERHPRRPELGDERDERPQVPRRRGFPDQEPHAGAQPLPPLVGRECLVVGPDPGRGVRLQRVPEHTGRVAVDAIGALDRQLRELARRARDHAREVHHLGEADHARSPEQALEVAGRERAPRRLEARRGHARRRGEVDVERQVLADVDQPVHAVGAEHVRDLVRVGDDGGRPERQHEARELGREQLRRLEVHVRVDEAGNDEGPLRVERLGAPVLAEPRDHAVADRDVDVEPLAREDAEDAAPADDEVGRLVTPRDGEPPHEITRPRHQISLLVSISPV